MYNGLYIAYGTVQLQLHVITRYHACTRVVTTHGYTDKAAVCHVNYVAACLTSTSNIVMHGQHAWLYIPYRVQLRGIDVTLVANFYLVNSFAQSSYIRVH